MDVWASWFLLANTDTTFVIIQSGSNLNPGHDLNAHSPSLVGIGRSRSGFGRSVFNIPALDHHSSTSMPPSTQQLLTLQCPLLMPSLEMVHKHTSPSTMISPSSGPIETEKSSAEGLKLKRHENCLECLLKYKLLSPTLRILVEACKFAF